MTALYDSLKTWILEQTCPDMPVLLMLSGAQGIGKSTVVKRLGETVPGLVCLGLDDFYLTRAERLILARDIHPLAETRGPPCTHDLALLNETLDQLLNAGPETLTSIPVFSKKLDLLPIPKEVNRCSLFSSGFLRVFTPHRGWFNLKHVLHKTHLCNGWASHL